MNKQCIHIVRAIEKLIKDRQYRRKLIAATGIYRFLSDKEYIKTMYYANTGEKLDLVDPKTFNEKLQWLKLYDRKPVYTVMADKYLAKKYVADIIGKEHVVPLIGVWENVEQIDFSQLPNRFVLKCNHNSGSGMVICKDKSKLDIEGSKKKLKQGLKQDYFIRDREWCYKDIPRRIIAEQYMEDSEVRNHLDTLKTEGLIDYKFYCFNGKPAFLYVGFANMSNGKKHDLMTFLTLDWEIAPFYRPDHEQIPSLPNKPEQLDKMIEYAQMLSKETTFVRVDFFVIDNTIYFSEFTFAPGGGYGLFRPSEWEQHFGEILRLPR